MDAQHHVPGALELGAHRMVDRTDSRREAHERRRNVEVLEAARHGVLAANGAHAQVDLGHERAEQRRGGLTPALGDVAQRTEILLEG